MIINHNCCIKLVPHVILSEIFLILRRTKRDTIKKLVFTKITRYSCAVLIKLEFSRQIFDKFSNIKFHENPSSGSRVVPYEQADRGADKQHEANSRPSHFCEGA